MSNPIHVAVILGSTREGRLCDTLAAWVAGELDKRHDLTFSLIDPASLDLPGCHENQANEGIHRLRDQLDRADAFVVITPEYNHSFPAALKFLVDSSYAEWQTKPVGFVSYGGISGGLRAVEQLRQVFAELHAVTVRDSVSFINVWEQFADDGSLASPDRAVAALQRVVSQLHWWATATRAARETVPYREVA
ncbi:NADPH-dependent FMN reductase [Halomonas caseinilytica]|uniref:NADPH-dependent FMN reductase n=1 Tax=Halomonas caseinilytica TaxID=438744 RepID=UPI0007E58923|nr:NAD(P)H-dependent oxidoreductase [Halomonas caseinilytica]SEN01209.1 NAD(P)H-dependent FMN reductase [Halomonas caseinilytica]